jgi:hypothetical protein
MLNGHAVLFQLTHPTVKGEGIVFQLSVPLTVGSNTPVFEVFGVGDKLIEMG